MATIVEINERLVSKVTVIAERVVALANLYEEERWTAELVIRLQSIPHISGLLGSGKLSAIVDKVTGGGSQSMQWLLDTYLELRLSCFENEAEWDYWCQYLTSTHSKIALSTTSSALPSELVQTLNSNKDPATTLKENPWVLVLFVFPQLRLRIDVKKKK